MKLIGEHKAKKGLIRVEIDEDHGVAKSITITGDFFIYPESVVEDLETYLIGKKIEQLESAIEDFFSLRHDVEMPYLNVEDFKIAVRKALEEYK
ncbi:lipoate--protein ligase [Thermococcus chitonophagus]|uniref:lipoate--protein ligase n=1 Tax=Thermococcus chitonophagus TaxID=54262 RepID=A0A2Z2NA28_9EURY|nr:lipoate protein ligase C-terminal domain-containing protein [Thermococcus chitonophagus]ASJ16372.1 lipoate--protein ligase [Thermococcus chitonophagus]